MEAEVPMKLVSKGLRYIIALGPEDGMPEGSYFGGNAHNGEIFANAAQLYAQTGVEVGEPEGGEIPDDLRDLVNICIRNYIPEMERAGYYKKK